MSDFFKHPTIGIVKYTFRKNSNRLSAYWKGGILNVSIPHYYTSENLLSALNALEKKILDKKPAEEDYGFFIGDVIPFGDKSIEIVGGSSFKIEHYDDVIKIVVNNSVNFNDKHRQKLISKLLGQLANEYALPYFRLRAAKVCDQLSLKHYNVILSRGLRTLAYCTKEKVIAVSKYMMFYPKEYLDYILCHELAHTSFFDHSPQFHKLCDNYCLKVTGKREADFIKLLAKYNFKNRLTL